MKKTAVIYWSGTGNTEAMANAVLEGMTAAGADAKLLTVDQVNTALQELLQDGHTAHTVVSHAEEQDKQQCHRHHHQYLRRGGNNGVDGQALLDGGIHREHQRQRNGDVGHAAEAGGTEDDAHHHDHDVDKQFNQLISVIHIAPL